MAGRDSSGERKQFGDCPDYYWPLEQARIVREYVGGNFTLYDALNMEPEDFKQVFVVAAGRNLAEAALAKRPSKKDAGKDDQV